MPAIPRQIGRQILGDAVREILLLPVVKGSMTIDSRGGGDDAGAVSGSSRTAP